MALKTPPFWSSKWDPGVQASHTPHRQRKGPLRLDWLGLFYLFFICSFVWFSKEISDQVGLDQMELNWIKLNSIG